MACSRQKCGGHPSGCQSVGVSNLFSSLSPSLSPYFLPSFLPSVVILSTAPSRQSSSAAASAIPADRSYYEESEEAVQK